MQINSSSGVSNLVTQQVSRQTTVDNQQQQTRAQEQQQLQQQEQQRTNQNTRPDSQVDRIQADEQAIAIVEQSLANPSTNTSTEQNANFAGNNRNTGYDQPSDNNLSAVAAYQSVSDISQRDNIQQVFGVDVFA